MTHDAELATLERLLDDPSPVVRQAVLAKLKELVCLDLYGTTFGDEAATAISTLPNLAKLELYGTKITDVGLKKLQSLKTLTSIGLGGTTTSLQAAADFQAALPQCRVNR